MKTDYYLKYNKYKKKYIKIKNTKLDNKIYKGGTPEDEDRIRDDEHDDEPDDTQRRLSDERPYYTRDGLSDDKNDDIQEIGDKHYHPKAPISNELSKEEAAIIEKKKKKYILTNSNILNELINNSTELDLNGNLLYRSINIEQFKRLFKNINNNSYNIIIKKKRLIFEYVTENHNDLSYDIISKINFHLTYSINNIIDIISNAGDFILTAIDRFEGCDRIAHNIEVYNHDDIDTIVNVFKKSMLKYYTYVLSKSNKKFKCSEHEIDFTIHEIASTTKISEIIEYLDRKGIIKYISGLKILNGNDILEADSILEITNHNNTIYFRIIELKEKLQEYSNKDQVDKLPRKYTINILEPITLEYWKHILTKQLSNIQEGIIPYSIDSPKDIIIKNLANDIAVIEKKISEYNQGESGTGELRSESQ